MRLNIRMCAALSYLPASEVENGWLAIMENSAINTKLNLFYDYFVEQWLENDIISKEMWICNGDRHRTNNSVEGWNNRLNNLIRTPHSNFYFLLKILKDEALYCDFVINRSALGLVHKPRKRKYVFLDSRIEHILGKFAIDSNVYNCLRSLAYIQKLE